MKPKTHIFNDLGYPDETSGRAPTGVKKYASRFITILFISAILLIFISSFWLTPGGLVHPETRHRLLYYLDERPIQEKIFDVQKNEIGGLYMGRELVVIFDIIDAYFIKLSHALGITHFFSLTHYLALVSIALLSAFVSIKYFHQRSKFISYLLPFVFLTSPAFYFADYFFRTAKTMTAWILAILITVIVKNLTEKKSSRQSLSIIFILSLIISLIDRPGLFLLLWFSGMAIIAYLFVKNKYWLAIAGIFLMGFIIGNIYNYVLGPVLIKNIVGYRPDFTYQGVDFGATLKQPLVYWYGFLFFLDNWAYSWGNFDRLPALIILVVVLWLFIITAYKNRLLLFLLVIGSVLAVTVFNTLQIWRHAPIFLWEDVKRLYYELPIMVLMLFFLNYVFARLTAVSPKMKKILIIFLIAGIIANIIALSGHFQIVRSGHLSLEYKETPAIVDCVKGRSRQLSPVNQEFCFKLKQVIY